MPIALDVRDPKAIKSAVKQAVDKFGKIDILVNGVAGIVHCAFGTWPYRVDVCVVCHALRRGRQLSLPGSNHERQRVPHGDGDRRIGHLQRYESCV